MQRERWLRVIELRDAVAAMSPLKQDPRIIRARLQSSQNRQILMQRSLQFFGSRLDGVQMVKEPPVLMEAVQGYHFPAENPNRVFRQPRREPACWIG